MNIQYMRELPKEPAAVVLMHGCVVCAEASYLLHLSVDGLAP